MVAPVAWQFDVRGLQIIHWQACLCNKLDCNTEQYSKAERRYDTGD